MRIHRFFTTLAATALLTASALPPIAHARGSNQPKAPSIEFTGDIDETSLFGVRNGIALSGLLRAALADSARTVTVVTDDAVVYEVSFDDDGEYTQVLNHGGRPGTEYEVAAAVSEFEREAGFEAVLAGDHDPTVDLELDIEGRIAGEIIGIVDVVAGPDYIEMIVVIDPTTISFDLDWIIQVVLPEILHGPCADVGYTHELCTNLGETTGCGCLDQKDPKTQLSTWEVLSDPDQPDGLQFIWDIWDLLTGKKDDDSDDEEGEEPETEPVAEPEGNPGDDDDDDDDDGDDDDGFTDPDDIAPWSEGPMLLVDQIETMVIAETFAGFGRTMDHHYVTH